MTEQMTELEELESIYCELHKDVHGVKARWYRAESVEQARKDIDALQAVGEVVWAQEQAYEQEAAVRFEARVAATIETGAGDRETALRWIHQAEGTGSDADLCYTLGLPNGYFRKMAVTA